METSVQLRTDLAGNLSVGLHTLCRSKLQRRLLLGAQGSDAQYGHWDPTLDDANGFIDMSRKQG